MLKRTGTMTYFIVGMALLLCFLIFSLRSFKSFTIAILQSASHSSIERTTTSLVRHLEDYLGKDKVSFIIENAGNSRFNADVIAKDFHNNKSIDAICTVGSLAAQAMANVERQKPIIMCAISNASAIQVAYKSSNICCISGLVNMSMLIAALRLLVPKATKIGVIFQKGAINTTFLIQEIESALKVNNIELSQMGVEDTLQIEEEELLSFLKTIDVLFLLPDNSLAQNIDQIATMALRVKKPVFLNDDLLLRDGICVAAGGINFNKLGILTAKIIRKILRERIQPNSWTVQPKKRQKIFIHGKTASYLKIAIPYRSEHHIIVV